MTSPRETDFSGPGGPDKAPIGWRQFESGGMVEIITPDWILELLPAGGEGTDGLGISREAEMALGVEGLRGSDVLCRELASRVVMEAETREGGAGISRDGAVEVVMEVLRRLGVVQEPFVPLSDPNIDFEEPTVPVDYRRDGSEGPR